jgi:hypothetical protein
MTETTEQQSPYEGKGKAFFDRADQVAETGNWDFAIELYIEGLTREPDAMERGHKPLRQVSMQRAIKGGKPAGMIDKLKHGGGKGAIGQMTNAEYLLAKEPGNVQYMMQILKAARSLELTPVVKWIADLALQTQLQPWQTEQKKPSRNVCWQLTEAFESIEDYDGAEQACYLTCVAAPNVNEYQNKQQELAAKKTIQKGRYDEEGDFTKGVKDLEKQKELIQSESAVKSKSFLEQQIEKTRSAYLADPTDQQAVNKYVEALLRMNDESYENEAIDILRKAYDDTKTYLFKMKIGDLRIKQYKRRYQAKLEQGDKEAATKIAKDQLAFELEEYTERTVNYPTDLGLKYELGVRQFIASKFDASKIDDAISSLQQAQRDPRRRVQALNYLGLAFRRKEWLQEAIDTFNRALENEMPEERTKELRYNLADAYEANNQLAEAQEQFSAVAQIDYNYKDTRDRLDKVRKQLKAEGQQE